MHSLKTLATSTRNAKRNRAPLRHAMFYGPPGTGKTMVAQLLARHCGLDFAIMSGGDVVRPRGVLVVCGRVFVLLYVSSWIRMCAFVFVLCLPARASPYLVLSLACCTSLTLLLLVCLFCAGPTGSASSVGDAQVV